MLRCKFCDRLYPFEYGKGERSQFCSTRCEKDAKREEERRKAEAEKMNQQDEAS